MYNTIRRNVILRPYERVWEERGCDTEGFKSTPNAAASSTIFIQSWVYTHIGRETEFTIRVFYNTFCIVWALRESPIMDGIKQKCAIKFGSWPTIPTLWFSTIIQGIMWAKVPSLQYVREEHIIVYYHWRSLYRLFSGGVHLSVYFAFLDAKVYVCALVSYTQRPRRAYHSWERPFEVFCVTWMLWLDTFP